MKSVSIRRPTIAKLTAPSRTSFVRLSRLESIFGAEKW